jgi:hypothetical protein
MHRYDEKFEEIENKILEFYKFFRIPNISKYRRNKRRIKKGTSAN